MIDRLQALVLTLAITGCANPASTPAEPPTAPAEPSSDRTSAAAGERGRLVGLTAAHNRARAKVGVPPLVWSRALARHAQAWADRLAADGCPLEHRRNDAYGENLYWSSAVSSASAAVATWAEEAKGYDHRTNSCRATCGHYTQMVWSTTRSLGCGTARCGAGEIWVCNYDPPGNFVGQSPF